MDEVHKESIAGLPLSSIYGRRKEVGNGVETKMESQPWCLYLEPPIGFKTDRGWVLYGMRISPGTFREASLFHPIISKLVQSVMSMEPLARSVGLQNAIEMALSLGHKTKIKEKNASQKCNKGRCSGAHTDTRCKTPGI